VDARAQIENLMAAYCRAYDEGDLGAYAALFAHGRITNPFDGTPMTTAEQIEDFHRMHVYFYDGLPQTRHVVTNIEIEVDEDAGSASGRCYLTVYQALPDFPLQAIIIGSFFDKFHRVEGTWYFLERQWVTHLMGDNSRHGRDV
jgi:hypothetical protein